MGCGADVLQNCIGIMFFSVVLHLLKYSGWKTSAVTVEYRVSIDINDSRGSVEPHV